MAVLEVQDLRKCYQRGSTEVVALDRVSLVLEGGGFVALMGPSGCGKSTLLHLCGAMDHPTTGDVRLEGCSLASLDEDALTRFRRQRVGFVFQFFNLLPTLTVLQNIGLPLLLTGRLPEEVDDVAKRWATRVEIDHRLNHYPSQLSGGEAQRAAIARAVIHEPVLILADEPTGNLDSETGAHILSLLQEVNRDTGASVLLATHDPMVADEADHVIRMQDGRITEPHDVSASGRAGKR